MQRPTIQIIGTNVVVTSGGTKTTHRPGSQEEAVALAVKLEAEVDAEIEQREALYQRDLAAGLDIVRKHPEDEPPAAAPVTPPVSSHGYKVPTSQTSVPVPAESEIEAVGDGITDDTAAVRSGAPARPAEWQVPPSGEPLQTYDPTETATIEGDTVTFDAPDPIETAAAVIDLPKVEPATPVRPRVHAKAKWNPDSGRITLTITPNTDEDVTLWRSIGGRTSTFVLEADKGVSNRHLKSQEPGELVELRYDGPDGELILETTTPEGD